MNSESFFPPVTKVLPLDFTAVMPLRIDNVIEMILNSSIFSRSPKRLSIFMLLTLVFTARLFIPDILLRHNSATGGEVPEQVHRSIGLELLSFSISVELHWKPVD